MISFSKHLGHFFVSIDQLGNVIAGGNPDNTISSRVGYYNQHNNSGKKAPWAWRFFEQIINLTFWPIDGDNHCHEAFHNDAGEDFDDNTKNVLVAILAAIIIIPSCLVIAVVLDILYWLGIISPKNIDRNKNISKRLDLSKAKLQGTLHELNEHKVDVDHSLSLQANEVIKMAQEVSEKIEGMIRLKERLA